MIATPEDTISATGPAGSPLRRSPCALTFAPLLACALCALLGLGSPAQAAGAGAAQKKLAVLEFAIDGTVDKAQIDRLYLSSAVQGTVQRLLPAGQYFIMTRENLQEILRGQGKSLEECQGNCEVETGRLLSADLVIAGRLSRVGARLKLALTLYQVASGQLLGTTIASGDSVEKLDDDIPAQVGELVAALLPAGGQRQQGPQPAARPKPQQALLFVKSQPDGALVKLDGQQAGPTPLSLPLKPGRYALEASLPGYLSQTREVTLALSDEPTRLEFTLAREQGKLSIASNVACEGAAGKTPFKVSAGDLVLLQVPTGSAQISCTASDGRVATASAQVDADGLASARLAFSAYVPPPPPPSDPIDFSKFFGWDLRGNKRQLDFGLSLGIGRVASKTTSGFGGTASIYFLLLDTLTTEIGYDQGAQDFSTLWVGATLFPFKLGRLVPYGGVHYSPGGNDSAGVPQSSMLVAYGGLGWDLTNGSVVLALEAQQGLSGAREDSVSYLFVVRFHLYQRD